MEAEGEHRLEEQEWKATTKELMIMATMAVCSLLVALDATILVPVLPTLAVELHGTAAEAFWTGTSYLLAHAVLQPFIASLSDIFGRRELILPSIVFFTVGSIICSVARDFTIMLTGRIVQGVGGAGIITISQLVFADLVPLRQRPKYFTMVLAAWAVGSLVGPVVGGSFVEKASWRWCFYINLPICGIALPMAAYFLSALSRPKANLITKIQSVDYVGNILFIGSLTSILIPISWAGISYSWTSYQVLVPLILGIAFLLITIAYEGLVASNPFLTRRIFNGRSAIASYCCAMLQGLNLYMALYYLAFYFCAVLLFGPIRTGLSIFPSTTFLLPGSAIVSALIARSGHFRWAVWSGFVISTVAAGLIITWDDKTRTSVWAVCEALFGVGMGMILSSVNFGIQAIVDPKDAGQAAAMYAFMRSIGMTIGVALGGTVFQNAMVHRLRNLSVPNADEIAKDAESAVVIVKGLRTSGQEGALRADIMSGYIYGFRGVWITMTILCGLGLVVSLLIGRGDLDKTLVSKFSTREAQQHNDTREQQREQPL